MADSIKIKFRSGKIRIYGNPADFDHIFLAAAKLRLQEVEPSAKVKFLSRIKRTRRNFKKLIRCVKFAVASDYPALPEKIQGGNSRCN